MLARLQNTNRGELISERVGGPPAFFRYFLTSPASPLGVKSAVPADWLVRQEYPRDRTYSPAKVASPSGHNKGRRPTSQEGAVGALLYCLNKDRSMASAIALYPASFGWR